MKRLLYFLLFLLFLSNCKDNKADESEILKLVIGKWHSIETEEIVAGEKKWQPIALAKQSDVSFSFDGVMLNKDNEPGCCPSSALRINGALFNIKSTGVNSYPCLTILCGETPPLPVEVGGDVMIVGDQKRVKYVRY
ncbi:hypothetical protein [Dyadobacter sp. LHD-138]|uniref:hypothetical protein n=1 Tax=Dyadobacter sp. LHD-138 TaxID=3071413 RepID=UPI0027DF072F|nr:hypothetical protein [Dyadobacter sp. LHD-138]MDQ6480792.1 hypothetical protein [Dyadobacter sp. LHD-138]